jgi:phosphoglycolate phosphatase-like HAD superfamily hydrolase
LVDVKRRGLRLVLASSGQRAHVEHLLGLIDGKQIADAWTTSEDADRSKPDPDLVQVALAKVGGAHGVVVGDSTWDAIAARRAGLPMIAVRTGGYSEQELRAEGAIEVFGSIVDLRHGLDASPLRGPD